MPKAFQVHHPSQSSSRSSRARKLLARRVAAAIAAVVVTLALPAVASAAACPASPAANGTGYAPVANTASLPPKGTGPDVLHGPLTASPQLENTGTWGAPPIMVSGAHAYRDGEFLYQDFLYDDRALTYPADAKRYGGNAADIVEVRIEPLRSATAIRVTFNTMLAPDAAAVTIGLGNGDAQAREMPHGAGAKMPADVFVTAYGCAGDVVRAGDGATLAAPRVTTDLQRRQLHIEVPYTAFDPRKRVVRVGAAAGLWDAGTNAFLRPDPARPAFFNVAFREYGPWVQNTWMDASQNAALAAGDLGPLQATVDFRKLAAKTTDDSDIPTTGPINRILVSRFEQGQGRGTSSGGDIFGNYACDPPACTHQFSGRLQPYSVYVPDVTRPAGGYGMVLNLHGANSNHNHFEGGSTEPPLSVWRMLAQEGHPSVMVMPNARGMTYCYYGLAGADVFEAWADAASHYRLDPDQAVLSGSSMGGFGTYKLATQFPDLFKAIFPNIAPEFCSIPEAPVALGVHTGRTGIGDAFASLRNVPVLATAGLDDPLVNVAVTVRSAARLDALAYRNDFWHFQSPEAGGHVEYRQFVRNEFGALHRTADEVDRDPRRVTYVLNDFVSDDRYGLRSDHAYWVGGLELADAQANPAMGTIDVTSGAIPGRAQTVLPTETAGGLGVIGARLYKRQSRRWRPGDAEPISDGFAMRTVNIGAAELDLRRMRLPEFGTVDGEVKNDRPLTLRLRGTFGTATTVTRNGTKQAVRTDGTTLTVVLPAGAWKLRITQPAPIAVSSCKARKATIRVRAPRRDRLRTVQVFVNGKRVRTVRGRAVRRAIRITVPATGARVVVRATTTKGRRLVRRSTLRACR